MDGAEQCEKVMYVYDRICTKQAKQRHLYHEYGVKRTDRSSKPVTKTERQADENGNRHGGRHDSRNDGQNAPHIQRTTRSAGYGEGRNGGGQQFHGERMAYSGRETSSYAAKQKETNRSTRQNGGARGNEAVRRPPLKLMLEKMVNLFESIEERGKKDELIAKKRALALKKLSEYRRIFLTSLLLVAITAAFVAVGYQLIFVVDEITIGGSEHYTEAEILAASGIDFGDTLYSFKASDVTSDVTFYCPYIKTAVVDRTIPNAVSLTVEDDSPMFYASVYGDRVILSAGLRVLDVLTDDEVGASKSEALIELILPSVTYSVAGRTLTFADSRAERYIRKVLTDTLASTLYKEVSIDQIDLSREYDITMITDGRYYFKFGGEADSALKLRMAQKILSDSQFDKTSPAARIDLSTVGEAGEASVIYQMKLTIG